MDELMLRIDNVSKQYILGQIGGTTLRDELQRRSAKRRGKEDPTKKIGAKDLNIGETFLALDGVSFDVKKGERVGIIGHNGAGKSTLLKLISRVTAPTSGRIGLNGRVASMLEVGTGFHPELTGRENIYMNGAILGMTKKEIDAKMEDIIDFSECRQFIDTPVKRYSSGMYVKLAFSVAAHLDSEIMIMDEVLAVGDMSFQQKCLNKMSDVAEAEGRTILYVSHNMSTIRQLCKRCVVLNHGKIMYDGDVEKGIECYSQQNNEMLLFNDFKERKRDYRLFQRVEMQNLQVLEKSDSFFRSDEKLKFCIRWKALIDLKDIYFRIVFGYIDSTKFGMSNTLEGLDAVAGEMNETILSIDLHRFASGKYFGNLCCYLKTGNGNFENCDSVVNALTFEVSNHSKETGGLLWYHSDWGHAVLPEIEVLGQKTM